MGVNMKTLKFTNTGVRDYTFVVSDKDSRVFLKNQNCSGIKCTDCIRWNRRKNGYRKLKNEDNDGN